MTKHDESWKNHYKLDYYQSHDMLTNISEWLSDVIKWLKNRKRLEIDRKLQIQVNKWIRIGNQTYDSEKYILIYFPNHLLLYSLLYMSWYGVHTMHDSRNALRECRKVSWVWCIIAGKLCLICGISLHMIGDVVVWSSVIMSHTIGQYQPVENWVSTPVPEYIVNSEFTRLLEVHIWHKCIDLVLQNLKVAAGVGNFMVDPMGCQHYAFTPLAAHITDPWKVQEFQELAKQYFFSSIQQPYWCNWRCADPSIFLIPEILHACHKFFSTTHWSGVRKW